MQSQPNRRGGPPDPLREGLVNVRRGLFRLHKTLIDAERAHLERERGPMSNGQFLQVLIQDPELAWLKPFSGLIVAIDEALADKEGLSRDAALGFVRQVQALVESPEAEAAGRYETVRQRETAALLAHVELTSRIQTALEEQGSSAEE